MMLLYASRGIRFCVITGPYGRFRWSPHFKKPPTVVRRLFHSK
jgi:hypothetical protein